MKNTWTKSIFSFLLLILASLSMLAQAPEGIYYQAEARKTNGAPLNNKNLTVKVTIHSGSPTGMVVWEGTHQVRTDNHGLFTIVIGEGTGGAYNFSAIPWESNSHFLNVKVISKGSTIDMGTTQFLSIPYALHAKTAAEAISFNETDPVFLSSPAYWITNGNVSNWDAAFSWGDHSAVGYLTSFAEIDPVFATHVAGTITPPDLSRWNTAYSWGDHSAAGYLAEEVDGSVENEIQDLEKDADIIRITQNPAATDIDLSPYKPLNENEVKAYIATGIAHNYLTKSENTHRLIQSQVYDDGSRVGIGINNPNEKLHVNGNIRAANNIYCDYIESSRIRASNEISANQYRFNSSETRYLNIPACAGDYMYQWSSNAGHYTYYSYLSTNSEWRILMIPVILPEGAVIKGMSACLNTSTGVTTCYLQGMGTNYNYTILIVNGSPTAGSFQWTNEITTNTTVLPGQVYNVRVSNSSSGYNTIKAIRIRYEISQL